MDENRLIKETERGNRAKRILEDDLWLEAWATIEMEFLSAWRNSPARDEEGREAIWKMLKVAERVRSQLESHMMTGRLAEKELEKHGRETKRTRTP